MDCIIVLDLYFNFTKKSNVVGNIVLYYTPLHIFDIFPVLHFQNSKTQTEAK